MARSRRRRIRPRDPTTNSWSAGPPPAAGFGRRLIARSSRLGLALDALCEAVDAGASPTRLSWLFEALVARTAQSVLDGAREPHRLSATRPATRTEIHRRLICARDAVEAQLGFAWTLAAMARAASMAPHHFHRCFAEAFGDTPRAWMMRRRAERAMALLKTTWLSVTDICFEVGYESLGSFSTAFRKRFGARPSSVGARKRRPGSI